MEAGSPEYLVVGIISKLLTDLVARNDQLPLAPSQVTPFHSSRPPAITVKSYLEDRILKYAGCSEETFILALIYMDQVVQFNPDFVISSLNVHRLLITAIMLASKFFDDVYYNNAYYARVGGISNQEVNSLEMEMLRMISFSLFVQPDQYCRYRSSLYAHFSPQSADGSHGSLCEDDGSRHSPSCGAWGGPPGADPVAYSVTAASAAMHTYDASAVTAFCPPIGSIRGLFSAPQLDSPPPNCGNPAVDDSVHGAMMIQ